MEHFNTLTLNHLNFESELYIYIYDIYRSH